MQAWIWLGIGSAFFAALVGIVGKRGLEAVDPTVATSIRAVIMAAGLAAAVVCLGKAGQLRSVPAGAVGWIAASGLAGAASWLCYFWALRLGPAGPVAALDRLSVVFALVLAALFLGEKLNLNKAAGGALIVAGVLLVMKGR